MSGVEVAGFVLGAFPLLISALEHYRETAEVLSDWWQIKREYRKCKDEIRFHQLAFEQNLEKYLLPMIADEEELQELIANPGGPQWRNPDLEGKLKERLPKAYDLFFSTILQMNETMQELEKEIGGKRMHFQKKLSAEEESLPPSDDRVVEKKTKGRRKRLLSKPNLEYETQRIKFTFGRNERNKLFQEIAGYNARLKELLDTTDQISAIRGDRTARRGQRMSKGLMQFWRHATSVFNLVTEAFRCQCSSLHHVNLRLEHRSIPEVRFNLLFLFDRRNLLSSTSPWNWMETRVSLLETDTAPLQITRSTSDIAAFKPGRPALKHMSRTMSSTDSATLVGSTESLPSLRRPAVSWESPRSKSPSLDISEIPEIDNLCESMSDVSKHSDSFGLLTGDGNLYNVVPLVENCKDNDTREFITLGDMIRTGKPSKLTRRQRFFIALTLCSSQLQLHKTPWLESGLHKNHILFAKGDKNIPILDNPYISRAFAASNKSSSPLPVSDSSISNLGIMLLELCFNATFEDLEARKKYLSADGTSNPYLDLAAAMEWCNSEAAEEAGPDFADAVRWCLGQFGASAPQEENWRQELFEKVVAPLQVCHQQYEGSG